MQFWLYAFKYCQGNVLVGQYDSFEDAYIERDRLDPNEYQYADILLMEWGKNPKLISSVSFEHEKGRTIVKKLKKMNKTTKTIDLSTNKLKGDNNG